jgi:hypothetical protein
MRWHDLLFMHWPVPAEALRRLIPAQLELDTYAGEAWLGVVPFTMSGVRGRWMPPVPGLSAFAELNVRTYVTAGGMPGVWFFSLDAESWLAVRGARVTFYLPYFDARMRVRHEGAMVEYRSQRTHKGASAATFEARYWPAGGVRHSEPESLEYFLTERYCLYSADTRGRVWRGHIHHCPWPLQAAGCETIENTMSAKLGVELRRREPLLHFAKYLEVLAWWPERV